MPEYHPGRLTLERFVRGDLFAHESRKVEDHLRSGCRACQGDVDRLLPVLDDAFLAGCELADCGPARLDIDDADDSAGEETPVLTIAFERLEQRLIAIQREREAAPGLLAELLARSPAERQAALRASDGFQTLALCDLLIDRSFDAGFADRAGAIELAELAIAVTDRLDAATYGASVVQDLKARAWAYLGNARRINSDLAGCGEAIEIAERLVEEGSADPLEEARILDLKASLLSDQGRFEDAAELLDRVIDIYSDVNEPQRMGRAMISKGVVEGYAGQFEAAIALIRDGLSRIELGREPRLALIARHNLVWFLNDSGRAEDARAELAGFRRSYRDFPDDWTELRLAWLEARIAAGLGRHLEAEAALLAVRQRSVERGLSYEAAMATLDLASLFLQTGRTAEVRGVVQEMLPVFVEQEVHRHALSALLAFERAVEMDRVNLELIREIGTYLLRARRNPSLPFRPRF